jgi:GNAT superfamily N-acetyltransferase
MTAYLTRNRSLQCTIGQELPVDASASLPLSRQSQPAVSLGPCFALQHDASVAQLLVRAHELPMSPYEITCDKARFDIEAIHGFLTRSYWSPGVPRTVVERSIANSLCFGVLLEGQQIGFARVITDKATFAFLADVYVLPEHRGKGLSLRLMEQVIRHPDLQGLRRMMLGTKDAHTLYEKFGFKRLAAPERVMEIHNPDVYSQASTSAL